MLLEESFTPLLVILLFVAVGIGITVSAFAKEQNNGYWDNGKLLIRENGFWDIAESFVVTGVTLDEVYDRLPEEDLKKYMGTYELQQDKNRIVFVHNGYEESFIGTLSLIRQENGENTYRLLINQYKTKHSSPNEISLNVLYTAVEKVFLGFNPRIKVKTEVVDRKVKHNTF